MELTLGFSPCPNDTFIFNALLNGKIDTRGLKFIPVIEDVETLNRKALNHELSITKLSFAVFPHVQDHYHLLQSGSALGNHCGPLVISKRTMLPAELSDCKVAIPGALTTAHFLFQKFFPQVINKREMIFSEIEDAVLSGHTDLGVIIHENRFTYAQRGLLKVADLGQLWEEQNKLPIPLGGIFADRQIPAVHVTLIDELIRKSVEYAFAHPEETIPFVRSHAQTMSEEVMWQHIRLYVNDFTVRLGEKGNEAIRRFLAAGELMMS